MTQLPCGRTMPARAGQRAPLQKRGWKERLASYLRAHELKNSESRNRIVEVLLTEPGHFSVQSLVKKVQAAHPKIGAATVYRNLPVLLGCGLVQETMTDEEGRKIYEVAASQGLEPGGHPGGHHDHIVCLDCDRIFEFHEQVIETAQDRVSKKMGFKPVEHRHVIYARCAYKS